MWESLKTLNFAKHSVVCIKAGNCKTCLFRVKSKFLIHTLTHKKFNHFTVFKFFYELKFSVHFQDNTIKFWYFFHV